MLYFFLIGISSISYAIQSSVLMSMGTGPLQYITIGKELTWLKDPRWLDFHTWINLLRLLLHLQLTHCLICHLQLSQLTLAIFSSHESRILPLPSVQHSLLQR